MGICRRWSATASWWCRRRHKEQFRCSDLLLMPWEHMDLRIPFIPCTCRVVTAGPPFPWHLQPEMTAASLGFLVPTICSGHPFEPEITAASLGFLVTCWARPVVWFTEACRSILVYFFFHFDSFENFFHN
jgi:hypothetical protein